MRALRARPDERYATAAAMAEELRQYLASLQAPYGPREMMAELQSVLAMAARERGEVETSQDPIPAAFRAQRSLHH